MTVVEPIADALAMVGIDMVFASSIIPCLPGFELNTLYKGEQSGFEVTKPDYVFQVATEDLVGTALDGLPFSLTDEVFLYSFEVSRPPFNDLTGWSVIYANFVGQTNV